MNQLLKQSTGATVDVGPILNADGTAYVTDDLTNADFLIGKEGTWSALHTTATAAAHVTDDVQGMFRVTLDTTDTATLGRITISPNKATLAGRPWNGTVLAAATFDALITNAAGAADGLAVSGASKKVAATVASGDGVDSAAVKVIAENLAAVLESLVSDIFGEAVPGSYASGSAGYALGVTVPAIAAKVATISTAPVALVSPVTVQNHLSLVQGDDYTIANGRYLSWTSAGGWCSGDIAGATVSLLIEEKVSHTFVLKKSGTVITATGTQKVGIELLAAETALLTNEGFAYYTYQLKIAKAGDIEKTVTGNVSVTRAYKEA